MTKLLDLLGLKYVQIGLAAIGVAMLMYGAWQWRHGGYVKGKAEVQALWDVDIAARTAKQLATEQANRAKEQDLNNIIGGLKNEITVNQAQRDIARAANADSLRKLKAALDSQRSEARADSTSTSRADDPRDVIVYQCAGAIVTVDEDAKRLTDKVTGLQKYILGACKID